MNKKELYKNLIARLSGNGKIKSIDSNDNSIYIDCTIYSIDDVNCYINNAINIVRSKVGPDSLESYDDDYIIAHWYESVYQRALSTALAAQALKERGREFVINDAGVSYQAPKVSDILMEQYRVESQKI